MDSATPPIFFTEEQKTNGLPTAVGFTVSITLFIILYFIIIIMKPNFFNLIRETEEEKARKRLKQIKSSERFVLNFRKLVSKFISIEHERILQSPGKWLSWVFLILWIFAVIITEVSLQNILKGNRDQALIQIGLILYFCALIGYFYVRVLAFYREKLELRKKVVAHRASLVLTVVETTNDTHFGSLHAIPSSIKRESQLSAETLEQNGFDTDFRYKRRIKHISPIFDRVDFSFFNSIQIAVLVTEFIQIASFPLRDLFRSNAFLQSLMVAQGSSSRQFIESVRAIFSVFSTGLISIDFNYVKFVICWWYTLLAFSVASLFILIEYAMDWEKTSEWIPVWLRKGIDRITSGSWVVMALPLINLFYLLILNAFLEPLGCLSSNFTPTWPVGYENLAIAAQKRMIECSVIHDLYPSRNTWYSLSGFTLAFLLFTICRTAQEPVPEDGTVNYTSRSELFTKSASIVLLLLYTLVPTPETSTVRGVIASVLLFSMVMYNIVIGSTFCRWVNFARSLSYITCLWMSVVIVYYTHVSNSTVLFQTGSGVWAVLGLGALVLWIIYFLLYYFFIMSWESKSAATQPTDFQMSSVQDETHKDNSRDDLTDVSEESVSSEYSFKRASILVHSMQPEMPMIHVQEERRKPMGPRPMRNFGQKNLNFPMSNARSFDSIPRSLGSLNSGNRSPV
jgi:hypothetical protein